MRFHYLAGTERPVAHKLGPAALLGLAAMAMGMASGGIRPPLAITPVVAAPLRDTAQLKHIPMAVAYNGTPALYAGVVAWPATAGDLSHPRPWNLYEATLRHFRPRIVATAPVPYTMVLTQLSAKWVAWENQDQRGDWQVWAMERASGRRILIDSSQRDNGRPPHPWMLPLLSLHGDALAWSRVTCGNPCVAGIGRETWISSIHLKQLPGGADRTVVASKSMCNQYWPSLGSRVLVWHQEGTCDGVTGTDVMILDRHTGRVRSLTHDHRSSEPSTNGAFVAWKEAPNRFSNGSIALLNLRTGERTVISTPNPNSMTGCPPAGKGYRWTVCDATPHVLQGSVVWLAAGAGTVMAFDLKTGTRYVLESDLGKDAGHFVPGSIGQGYEDTAIWQSGRILTKPRSASDRPIQDFIAVERVP